MAYYVGRRLKGVFGWLFQRITGVILFSGLIAHFYVMHFSGLERIKHESVLKRLSSPYWIAFDFIFLVSVIYHGFNGLWGVALEYVSSKRLLKFLQWIIFMMALLLVTIGVYILAM